MAAIDNHRASFGHSFGRVQATIVSAIGAVATWNDARVTRNSLSKLSARELDDIGLCRGDIDDLADRISR